ncbi:MAG: type II toxin-antitoxin system VapB family antitoxin [Candidatus Binataceae bacterium]
MALNIKHPEADRLARELAEKTGETITEVVIEALRERLAREEGRLAPQTLAEEILAIGRRCAALPELDSRTPDEIIGYDKHGAFD